MCTWMTSRYAVLFAEYQHGTPKADISKCSPTKTELNTFRSVEGVMAPSTLTVSSNTDCKLSYLQVFLPRLVLRG